MTTLRLTPLGGVGRFGRNCLLVELEQDGVPGDAILVDCGVRFVADEMPGFDLGLPDLERIGALGNRLLAYVITHGHEDHIGGLAYAARENRKPIVATPFTARLIARKFERLDMTLGDDVSDDAPAVDIVRAGDVRTFGAFRVTWVNVSHSIPDATCVVIETPLGALVHSGDFRVDENPVLGAPTDIATLTRVGDAGVLCLLADSTGALSDGRNPGEKSVWPALLDAFEGAGSGRVAVALFASHVQRLALVADACRQTNRRLCLLGTGLREVSKAARELGYLSIDDVLIDEASLRSLPRERICMAVTGSQGEPESALARMSRGEHPVSGADLDEGDTCIVSARIIPGNEKRMVAIADALVERGVLLVDGRDAPHVSGHGYAGDLEMLLMATRPRSFVALHGNARNLLAHADLAAAAGVPHERVVDLREGSTLVIDGDGALDHLEGVRAHEPLASHGEVTMFAKDIVLSRKRMASAGVLVVSGSSDGAHLEWRGTAPSVSGDLLRAVQAAALVALGAPQGDERTAATKRIVRLFWKAGRPPPEIVVVH